MMGGTAWDVVASHGLDEDVHDGKAWRDDLIWWHNARRKGYARIIASNRLSGARTTSHPIHMKNRKDSKDHVSLHSKHSTDNIDI